MPSFAQKEILYVGTYSQRDSKGIYVFKVDRKNLDFKIIQTISSWSDPNFLAIHPNGKYLYSVVAIEDGDGIKQDAAAAFKIDKSGMLSPLNQVPTHGKGACHISLDRNGDWAFVSHYDSGSLAVFPVLGNGCLGDTIDFIQHAGSSLTTRQTGPHVHSALVSPDNKYLYVADLGTDKTMIYSFNEDSGKLDRNLNLSGASQPGAGPRHFTFHPSLPFLYLAEELSSSVTVFRRDEMSGSLSPVQNLSTLPDNFEGDNAVADIHITSNGKFVYVSNRGHNSIAIFSAAKDGKLKLLAHEPVQGDHPRNFLIDPRGEFLLVANKNTDNIVVFIIDKKTGLLKYSGTTLYVPSPVCLKWKLH